MMLGPSSAGAANGDNVVLGADNYEESPTRIDTSAADGSQGLIVYSGPGTSIEAQSSTGAALTATTDSSTRSAIEANGRIGIHAIGSDTGLFVEAGRVGVNAGTTDGGEAVVGNTWDDDLAAIHGINWFNGPAVAGENREDGNGVFGRTNTERASGVSGVNQGNGPGVQGENQANGNGVFGLANNSGASGVYGQNDGTGFGVAGRANAGVGLFGDTVTGTAVQAHSESGTAILALTTSGTALAVHGKMTATRSGIVPVGAGKKQVSVQVPDMNGKTFALATVQGPPAGVWVVSVSVASSTKLVIYLNAAAKVDTAVGWFVLG
jgi:hypothetical protein